MPLDQPRENETLVQLKAIAEAERQIDKNTDEMQPRSVGEAVAEGVRLLTAEERQKLLTRLDNANMARDYAASYAVADGMELPEGVKFIDDELTMRLSVGAERFRAVTGILSNAVSSPSAQPIGQGIFSRFTQSLGRRGL